MLNYRLYESEIFVKFYEKDGDTLKIHYGNNTTHSVPDTNDTRKRLNEIMEQQVLDNKTRYYIESVKDKKVGFTTGSIAIPVTVGMLNGYMYLCDVTTTFICTAIATGVGLALQSYSIYNGRVLKDHKKNELYLKYKEEIQEYLTCDEEENTLNPVQTKEVLSINDVHFMSYREMKNMTDDISKILDSIETDKKRDDALGVNHEKVLFKQRAREFKKNIR